MTKTFLFTFLSLFQIVSFAQMHIIDSMYALIRNAPDDTSRVNYLNDLAYLYRNSKPDSTIILCKQSIALCERIAERTNHKLWIGYSNAVGNLAIGYRLTGDFVKAKQYYFEALRMDEILGHKFGIGKRLVGIANVYDNLGNYSKGIEYGFKALRANEEINNARGIALSYGVIGNIYFDQKEYGKSIVYVLKGLKTFELINDKNNVVATYQKLGIIYCQQGKYSTAFKYLNKALQIAELNKLEQLYAETLNSMGYVFLQQKNYEQALKYYFKGLEKDIALGINTGISNEYNYIGYIYMQQRKFVESERYLLEAIKASTALGALNNLFQAESNLSELYSLWNKTELSYKHFKIATLLKDSIFNKNNTQQIMNIEFETKQLEQKAQQDKKDLLVQSELRRQKLIRNGLIAGFFVVVAFAGLFFSQRNRIAREKNQSEIARRRSDELLLNILPEEVADELKATGGAAAKQFDEVTVLFTDFKDFTQISEQMTPKELVEEIHTCFKAFDTIIAKYDIEKIKTIGDSYMCASGLPVANTTHATNIVGAALEIQNFILEHSKSRIRIGKVPFEIRIGIHTGPVVAGIVGIKKFAYDIWGDTVNTASRMESSGEPGKTNISGVTFELIKSDFNCTYRGKLPAKHKGDIDMYFVEGRI